MRLYKKKDTPKPHRNTLDSPPGLPSNSPVSTTPDRFKRAAEAVSKQISGHKAMVAQFKDMRLPRPPLFSAKSATSTDSDRSHSLSPTQSKAAKRSGKPQSVPARASHPKASISTASLKQRPVLSNVDTNLLSPTRPPGLAIRPVNKPSTPRAAQKIPRSTQYPIRPSSQESPAKPSTCPSNNRTSTGTDLVSVSEASAPTQVEVDEPLISASCFHSLEDEDLEIEDELLQTADVTSDFESQVARIFGVGLGYVSEDEVVKDGEVPPPKVTPEAMLAPTLEPMSAVVERWESTVKPKGETDGFEAIPLDHQNQIACVPLGDIGNLSPSLSYQPGHPTSILESTVRRQPPSSGDFKFVASLFSGALCSIALCVHKQSRRHCAVKIISNVVLEDERTIRAVLAEQRIMREVSRYPFLLGLLASFRGDHGLYLVTVSLFSPVLCDIWYILTVLFQEYCCSTLFDGRFHMPESYKKLASAELVSVLQQSWKSRMLI
jgi:hypothetical protein